jgi:hypothetical protein
VIPKELILAKLLEVVSKVTGLLLTRSQLRKQVELDVYRIKELSEAVNSTRGLNVSVSYDKDGLKIEQSDNATPEVRLVQRAAVREQVLQIERQRNVEKVLELSAQTIEAEEFKSEPTEEVSDDWLNSFFDKCQDFSDEQMQQLWARVLVGEISRPNSFSMRTLETLKVISKAEAQLFERFAQYALVEIFAGPYVHNYGRALVPVADRKGHAAGLSYDQITELVDAGLIGAGGELIQFSLQDFDFEWTQVYKWGSKAIVSKRSQKKPNGKIQFYKLTDVGKELLSIVEIKNHGPAETAISKGLEPCSATLELSDDWQLVEGNFEWKTTKLLIQ